MFFLAQHSVFLSYIYLQRHLFYIPVENIDVAWLSGFGIEHSLGLVWWISQEIMWAITSQLLLLLSLLQSHSQAWSYSAAYYNRRMRCVCSFMTIYWSSLFSMKDGFSVCFSELSIFHNYCLLCFYFPLVLCEL